MIAVLTPFVNMTRGQAQQINCAKNLRKISLGLHAYAADNKGAFPQNLTALYPNYVDDKNVFNCPASKIDGVMDVLISDGKIAEVKKDTVMIDFNHPLAGKVLTFDVKILSIQ